ncbi:MULTISPECIES: Holliday junction resolvase RuvX [Corynebacterium]|uniref:Putative pre-16S rRNA nuclease n=2 Tax=Corynebacterium TaxID=1716 RepID=A0ABT0TCL3_9CORY|nr:MULTISPECIES: Holliday junction resolvase RuvX [Corynebacterium]MDK6807580.1 Holliday junction resolvase RuvX [Corynebacterium aurimucosum]MCL8494712.1 Holliday junction resolvase RuvX [Corynebacterium intestinale]MCP1390948.1 Holliday junction resolvase RuvX [Corynebacterium intestinale]NJJ82646.1 Holliday junction resolvase RuvX [Corynebacterium aurimucosum]OFK95626.1 crossover junction endodeoxyribonuclease RuvA [Corynebacterium sp. HMSC068H04]
MAVEPDKPGVDDPGPGRRLGLDVGTVRIGVAVSDRDARLAMPVETVRRETGFKDRDKGDIDRLLELIYEYDVVEVAVGLPRDLKGNGSSSVKHAKEIAFRIRRRLAKDDRMKEPPPVRMVDERLTTVVASSALRASGVSEKRGRSVIDQAAAVEILQSWLDARHFALNGHSPSNVGDEVREP